MPRPLIRWKSLWFGILILAFIGWAWIRSTTRQDALTFDHGSTVRIVGSMDGSLAFIRFSFPGKAVDNWHFETILFDPDEPTHYFPAPFIHNQDSTSSKTYLAWWLIALTFILPWTALLTWRHHRMKRLALRSGDTPVAPAS
ncbi:hypothetical protein [Luteolibacter soli]|uniref:DUF3592 domain-containing protein n=1 Tax=Luteolibacter soli TaxID=3135280 RepID=A0ABU9AX35_9BACT